MRSTWVYPTAALTLAVAGAFIAQLRLSDIPDPAIGHSPHPPAIGRAAQRAVEYHLDGPAGAAVFASYLDADGTVRETTVTLPWQTTVHTRRLTLPTGVMAQTQDAPLSCRILIDGQVRDEHDSQTSAVACKVVVS